MTLSSLHHHQVLHHVYLRLKLLRLQLHELLNLVKNLSVLLSELKDVLDIESLNDFASVTHL